MNLINNSIILSTNKRKYIILRRTYYFLLQGIYLVYIQLPVSIAYSARLSLCKMPPLLSIFAGPVFFEFDFD